jgi:hypothetical protein
MTGTMGLGFMLPLSDIGGEPSAGEISLAAEEIGFANLGLPDHVLGVNVASRPDRGDRNTSADLFHHPFVCLGCQPPRSRGWSRDAPPRSASSG